MRIDTNYTHVTLTDVSYKETGAYDGTPGYGTVTGTVSRGGNYTSQSWGRCRNKPGDVVSYHYIPRADFDRGRHERYTCG